MIIDFSVPKLPTSQIRASTHRRTIATLYSSKMEVGSNFYGLHKRFVEENVDA